LLLLLLHQGANQGFELLDAIANTSNGGLSLRIRCIGAGESNVLDYASLARKLTIASDSVNGRRSVSFSYRLRSLIDYLRLLQKLHDNCCFSRRRSRRRVDSVAVSIKPECGVVEVGAWSNAGNGSIAFDCWAC